MKAPKIILYPVARVYKKDFLRKIRPVIRKKFKKKKDRKKMMHDLKNMLPDGLANYSRGLNTISISLQSICEDMCRYARTKKEKEHKTEKLKW